MFKRNFKQWFFGETWYGADAEQKITPAFATLMFILLVGVAILLIK